MSSDPRKHDSELMQLATEWDKMARLLRAERQVDVAEAYETCGKHLREVLAAVPAQGASETPAGWRWRYQSETSDIWRVVPEHPGPDNPPLVIEPLYAHPLASPPQVAPTEIHKQWESAWHKTAMGIMTILGLSSSQSAAEMIADVQAYVSAPPTGSSSPCPECGLTLSHISSCRWGRYQEGK